VTNQRTHPRLPPYCSLPSSLRPPRWVLAAGLFFLVFSGHVVGPNAWTRGDRFGVLFACMRAMAGSRAASASAWAVSEIQSFCPRCLRREHLGRAMSVACVPFERAFHERELAILSFIDMDRGDRRSTHPRPFDCADPRTTLRRPPRVSSVSYIPTPHWGRSSSSLTLRRPPHP